MKKVFLLLSVVMLSVLLVNCRRDDDLGPGKLRDYQTQYNSDIADIEEFLKTHRYEEVIHPGFPDDGDVIFHEVPENDPTCIFANADGKLHFRMVEDDDIEYKLWYLKLRDGGGAANDKPYPTNVDAVLAAYTGKYLFHFTETDEDTGEVTDDLRYFEFETNPFPQSYFNLEGVIRGWSEVFPQFRAGDIADNPGNPDSYSDFGAGVMFIPSGLGYYQASQSAIPAYSPLIFTFKLYAVSRLDQDGDGIPSYLEDIDGDRYIYIKLDEDGNGLPQPDDTDGDGAPDYLDLDDDGDNVLTKTERRRPRNSAEDPIFYYEYNGAAVDDPETPYDDTQGIPDCNGDFSSPTRFRRYLDPSCTGNPFEFD